MLLSLEKMKDESGGITIVNIFFIVAVAIIAGVAVDVSSLVSSRTQLQTTADAAAHAALEAREWMAEEDAKAKAIEVVEANMPLQQYGPVLTVDDVVFGDYDVSNNTFTPDSDSRNAVIVQANRLAANGNSVASYLLSMIGFPGFDVRTAAVYVTYRPTCLVEGFVAQGVVDIQSNNSYFNGFCIHSNSHVEVNNNNFFEAGTIVSMPDTDDLVVPNDGLDEDKNAGLVEALREGRWFIKVLNRLDLITEGVQNPDTVYAQSYITDYTPITVNGKNLSPADFTPGRIHTLPCNNSVKFEAGVYENIVVISECRVQFVGSEFHNAVIISKDTGSKSMSASSNVILGKNDDCDAGGGAIFVSYGTVDFSASMEMHGSQIIAADNVEFQANADGIRGASIVAGGRIDGTSNMNFAFCGSGMTHVFQAEYFRLAG